MNPTYPMSVVNHRLLEEVANTSLSLETVFHYYGAAIIVAAALWVLGVIAFGNCRSEA